MNDQATTSPAPAAQSGAVAAIAPEALAEQLSQAVASLLQERAELFKKRDTLAQEIEQIRSLPISQKELGDLACQNVDALAASYGRSAPVTTGLDAFRRARGEAANLRLLDAQKIGEDGALAKIALGVMGGNPQPSLPWFCFYFGDVLKARLRDAFADEQPRGVTTIQQRRDQIAMLSEQIDQLEGDIRKNEEVLQRLGHRFYGELARA